MRGDFSRLTFRPENHYSGVRFQQGRVQLDAEFNEHVDIETYRDQSTARDLIGRAGAPYDGGGFLVSVASMLRGVAAGQDLWAVGEEGTILRAPPNAAWTLEARPANAGALNAISLATPTTGFAVGAGATIFALSGTAWTAESAPAGVDADLYDVHAAGTNAWVVGAGGTVLFWDGSTWEDQTPAADTDAVLRGVHFAGGSGWIVGEAGTVLTTTDGGDTWTPQATPAGTGDLHGVFFVDPQHGWAVGEQGTILFFDGSEWVQQPVEAVTATLRAVRFTSATSGTAVGDGGTILVTPDGKEWSPEAAAGVRADLRALDADSGGTMFAVGDDVALRRAGQGTWTKAPALPALNSTVRGRTLMLSAGDLYVEGVRCENERPVSFGRQPEPPLDETFPPATAGTYGVYLKVQEQHLTAVEREELREVALGGADTATRTRTVWQAGLLAVSGSNPKCPTLEGALPEDPPRGRLRARAKQAPASTNNCIVSPNGAYRRLENQLYRVEIHDASSEATGATYKWSRDNGSVAARLLSLSKQPADTTATVRVSHPGRDELLGFGPDQVVELTDEGRVLRGDPGVLADVDRVEGDRLFLSGLEADPLSMADFPERPIVRRWDGRKNVDAGTPDELEDGVFVEFAEGPDPGDSFRTGDYWTIPARSLAGAVDWPESGGVPRFEDPHGSRRLYAPLALVDVDASGVWSNVRDCRRLFPPLTGLVHMYYVGGDGQEVMPDPTVPSDQDQRLKLDQPLEVGVSNWRWPVEGASVQFERILGDGSLNGPTDTKVLAVTDKHGIARCDWYLDGETRSQTVEATLLDDGGSEMQTPIRFNANLSTADQVAYDPSGCQNLLTAGAKTVQAAVKRLAGQPRMVEVAGDAQEVLPDDTLDDIRVRVENGCGPIAGAKVRFTVTGGDGTLAGGSGTPHFVEDTTDDSGIASAAWTLGAVAGTQYVEARLLDDGTGGTLLPPPPVVMFSANLSRADHVAYTPPAHCRDLEASTVKEALDELCVQPFAAYAHFDGHGTGKLLERHNVASFSKAAAAPGRYSFVWERPLPTSAPVLALAHSRVWPGGSIPLLVSVLERKQTRMTFQVVRGIEYGGTEPLDGNLSFAVLGAIPEELPPEPPPPMEVEVKDTLPVGSWSSVVVAADLDRSGAPDLVVGGNGIRVFLNAGDGTFGDANMISDTSAYTIAVADVNGEGNLDLVSGSQNNVTIYHGNGDGTFGDPLVVNVGMTVYAVAVGPLTEPGRSDIAAACVDGNVRILSVNADGAYDIVQTLETGINSYAGGVSVAAATENALADIYVAYPGANQVAWFRSKGSLEFDEPVIASVPGGPYRLLARDLTGNGTVDVVALCSFRPEAVVLLGGGQRRPIDRRGAGLVEAGRHFVGYGPGSLDLADVNGDGNLDLIVGSSGVVAVLPGTGGGRFGDAVPIFTPFGGGDQSVAAADFSGDGRVDIAAASSWAAIVNILVSK
jgi:photosystem II stability/assembly factor-like uncharacterized protein